jgi:hypothetical protein
MCLVLMHIRYQPIVEELWRGVTDIVEIRFKFE